MTRSAPDSTSQFPEAASWFLGRLPMTRPQWDKLTKRAQRKAFMVSGVAHADVLHSVFRELDKAVAKGQSLGEFRRAVKDQLESQWRGTVANPSWRIEVIFRQNVQSAYAAGRVRQMRDPAVAKSRPYWMLDVVLDTSTTLICEPLAGTVLPSDDKWWRTHTPPLHFACRSGIRCLRREQAESRGITSAPEPGDVAKGFGLDPDASEWTPDLSRFPSNLRKEVESRLASMPVPTAVEPPVPVPAVVVPIARPAPNPRQEPKVPTPAPAQSPAAKAQPVEQDASIGDFKTLEEAHAWASKKHPGVQWDFDGAHIDAINPTLQQFDKLAQEWPEAAASIKYVGTYQGKNSPRKLNWDKEEPRAIAMWDSERNHLAINPKFYNNPVEFAKKKKYDESIGWYVTGSKDIASMLSHEFGHVVDTWMLSRPSPLKDQWLAFKEQNSAELAKLSMYAAIIPTVEGVAEAFARQHHGGKTKQPVVKKMVALIRAAQKQGGK